MESDLASGKNGRNVHFITQPGGFRHMLSCHRFLGDTGQGLLELPLLACVTSCSGSAGLTQLSTSSLCKLHQAPRPGSPTACQVPLRHQALPCVEKLVPWRKDIATWSRCEL
ncbi:hypothetical protein PAL_GLEAN10005188 [Pteropus alecto]|uniref:Uncharacterized protein n=1 Tax=Pteropus alecto TaxID=9402 RepID=L5K842_PTEAL|nr:hypothetical protein PAL_GLEAN10005188 [Pteropus alecto]